MSILITLKRVVNANICFNKRNGDAVRKEFFEQEL